MTDKSCPFPPERSAWVWSLRERYILSHEIIFSLYRMWVSVNDTYPVGFEEICEIYYNIRDESPDMDDSEIIVLVDTIITNSPRPTAR